MKKLISILLAVAMILALCACGGQSAAPAEDGAQNAAPKAEATEKKKIAIVPWDMAETFAVDFAHAATESIESMGWEAIVMDPKGDWAQEYTILENLITQGIDGVIYTAIDSDGANDIIAEFKEAGIPIVGYDCLASDGTEDAAVRYNDVAGGALAAQYLLESLENKEDPQIILFESDPSISSSILREQGFIDYMKEHCPNADIVLNRSQDISANGCYTWANDMITAYPDADGFFCYWSDCTMATYNALKDAGITDVRIAGYDATEDQKAAMAADGVDGLLQVCPGMSAAKMARQCVQFLDEIYNGTYERTGPEDIYEMDPVVLTAENAAEFDINA